MHSRRLEFGVPVERMDTNKQIQAYAKRLAKEAGKIEDRWPEHQAHARDELTELLR